jgi:hypothetical protein
LAVTETSNIVLVAAKSLLGRLLVLAVAGEFELERAELMIDDVPHHLIGSHGGRSVMEKGR